MSLINARLPVRVAFTVMAAASCSDDAATDATTQGSTGTTVTTTQSTPETTSDTPTSSGDPGTGAVVDPSTGPVDPTTGTTDAPELTDTSTTTAQTDTTATTARDTDTGATPDTDTDDSTTSTGEPAETDTGGADAGMWCGAVGTGPLELDAVTYAVRFVPSHGGPSAFVAWGTANDEIRAAVYDVASATWGEPTTLQTGYDPQDTSYLPVAAVDGQGNAVLAYLRAEPQWQAVVQHYDAATAAWTAVELPGSFVKPRIGDISITPGGHAVLGVLDKVGPNLTTVPTVWFHDPVTGVWSDPVTYAPLKFLVDPPPWAQDPATGDAALVVRQDSKKLLLQHRAAATGTLTSTEVDLDTHSERVAAIGDGQFVVVTNGAGSVVRAHHFDGVAWQPPEIINGGTGAGTLRIVGGTDGRAIASWGDSQLGTHVRVFDQAAGWGDLLTATPTNPNFPATWDDHRVVFDGAGFLIVASVYAGSGIHTFARRHDGVAWKAPVELDPAQPSEHSRIAKLAGLGAGRALALWRRDTEGQAGVEYVYACEAPGPGWSAPTVLPVDVARLEVRPGGDVLVISGTEVEYFAAN